jgi:hypothetical protein
MQEIVIADFSCLSLILCGVPCKSLFFFSLFIIKKKKTFTDHSFRLIICVIGSDEELLSCVKVIIINLPFLSLFAR